MVGGCVKRYIIDLNMIPAIDGLSENISPATMITGRACPEYSELCKLNFGDYVHAYQRRGKTHTNRARCVGAIALYPSGIEQGGGILCHWLQADAFAVTNGKYCPWVRK